MSDLDMDDVELKTDMWLDENELEDSKPEMLWLDIETTGLDPLYDDVLEVGAFVTDKYGFVCPNGIRSWVVMGADLSKMDDYVRNMHEASGLLAHVKRLGQGGGTSVTNLETMLSNFIIDHFGDNKPPLAGSTVHFDRAFINRVMPKVLDAVHYRNIDVSTTKELARLHHPRLLDILAEEKKPMKAHRVVPDIIDSIEEYRFYLAEFLWTQENVDGIADTKP